VVEIIFLGEALRQYFYNTVVSTTKLQHLVQLKWANSEAYLKFLWKRWSFHVI